ncbi:hypothetical protein C8J57DRAFT_1235350 [Mycena rebaudengoi]|nr:hypothetical protein C8J57DRAFT_1235350 [Mycena rebaudengoi]
MPMAESEDSARSRSLRSELRTQISELDARILALEDSLAAAARREREELNSRLGDYKYPILTLPVEITSEIFIAFLPVYPKCPDPMIRLLSPTLLGQVCRNWREIAFETPRLWRAIELHLWNKNAFEAQLTVLKTWLERSKDCSLSLSLTKSYMHTPLDLSPYTDVIISHAARWEYVKLMLPSEEYHWIEASFPLLRHLTIAPSTYETESRPAKIILDNAPQLGSVVLGEFFKSPPLVLSWAQLTSIDVARMTPIKVVAILRQVTALVNFHGTLWDDIVVPGVLSPLVHLQSLIIRDGNNCQDPQRSLLDELTTPALRNLSISERELGIEPISTIASLFSRSRCALESLYVSHSKVLEADYCAAFPSIKAIEFFKDDSDDESGKEDEEDGDDED